MDYEGITILLLSPCFIKQKVDTENKTKISDCQEGQNQTRNEFQKYETQCGFVHV